MDADTRALNTPARNAMFAPFRVRSFRYQWPSDLSTSFAFEMETLILGWYVLVETESVLMLTIFASLQFLGTLFAPMFGVMGDRVGHRNLLTAMRAFYALLALTLMSCAFLGVLTPVLVLCIAAMMGMVRPSDLGTRNTVIGEIMRGNQLMGAMGIQRTTQDSARIAGALTGAGLVATLGMAYAYVAVAGLYILSTVLVFLAGRTRSDSSTTRPVRAADAPSAWKDLRSGLSYVWNTPHLRGVMCLALLVNTTAFPLFHSLLPFVVKDVYGAGQTTLGYLVASASSGALLGSLMLSHFNTFLSPARLMIIAASGWHIAILIFAQLPGPLSGAIALFFGGIAQSLGMVSMATILLRHSEPQYRGRVMGIRMLMIYANVPGLLLAGPLIGWLGYPMTATLYCLFGLTCIPLITRHWRQQLWNRDSMSNTR